MNCQSCTHDYHVGSLSAISCIIVTQYDTADGDHMINYQVHDPTGGGDEGHYHVVITVSYHDITLGNNIITTQHDDDNQ